MAKNLNDINKVLAPYIRKALELTRDTIFEKVSQKILEYYNEPVFDNSNDSTTPVYYERTGRMMEEFTAFDIEKHGNEYSFKVGYPNEYLIFHYPSGFISIRYGNTYNGITGLQVLKAFNDGTHGCTVQGNHNYWNEAINELGGEQGIINMFKQNCKRVGVPLM